MKKLCDIYFVNNCFALFHVLVMFLLLCNLCGDLEHTVRAIFTFPTRCRNYAKNSSEILIW